MPSRYAALTALCLASVLTGLAPTVATRAQTPAGLQPPDRDETGALLASAEALLRERKGAQARPMFERALESARAAGLDAEVARAHSGLGQVLVGAARYDAAREHGLKALAIYERLALTSGIGRACHVLGQVEELSGNIPAARELSARAVAAFDSAGDRQGRAVATLQMLRAGGFDLDAQAPLYERVVNDARAVGDPRIEARALHSLGDHLFIAGQYEDALDRLTRAAAIVEPLDSPQTLGTIYNSLGRVYRAHGRLDEALNAQQHALGIHEHAGSPLELMQSLNAVATVHQRTGNVEDARTHYERALVLAEQSSSQRVQDLVRANLASLLIDMGQYAAGAAGLEQVIANGVDSYPGQRYSKLSQAYVKMARLDEALIAADRAVEACAGVDTTCIGALGSRATVHAAHGNFDAALVDVNAALATLESIRARLVPLDFFKQDFHRSQEDVYSLAIGLQVRERQAAAALATAELARARAFLDLLASRDLGARDGRLSELARHAAAAPPSAPDLQQLALTLRGGSAEALTSSAPAATPELASDAAARPSAVEDLVATAARLRSALLVYWVAADDVFIWVVAPEGLVASERVAVRRARLVELVRATAPFPDAVGTTQPSTTARSTTRAEGSAGRQRSGSEAFRELYALLIAPVRAHLPAQEGALLTIVPHGPLLSLSFAALQDSRRRYFIEDYTLHYAPAGALLPFTAARRRGDARTGQVLIVADPASPRLSPLDRPLARLPGARKEAAAIAALVPADKVTLLQGAPASEARLRSSASGKAVLHFATHAVVRDHDPFMSFLALGPSDDASDGDGILTSAEVYGLDLDADLVVLSACRSAGGLVTGDGIAAFARAFVYAGTASLVASLWDVADQPANRLLPDFYRAWLAGESKASALRSSQRRLLRDLRAGRVRIDTPVGPVAIPEHPVFWAGFVVFGEP